MQFAELLCKTTTKERLYIANWQLESIFGGKVGMQRRCKIKSWLLHQQVLWVFTQNLGTNHVTLVTIFLTAELLWESAHSIPSGSSKWKTTLKMTNVYHFDGLIIFVLLVICTCAYIKRVPRLKQLFLSEKKGLFGALYKAAVIGTRLHWAVSIACVVMAFYVLL